jgi:BirA family biotin operon repressor/biotin-[acetyl-CoA-carboxylase] ligase
MTRLGIPRHFQESLASTMDTLNALAQAGAPEGTLVVAGEQRAGRGRAGRVWSAPGGTALLCSVLLRPPLPPHALGPLPLIAGLAVAETVDALIPVNARLKWPNDVFIGELKVSGVLMQARAVGGSTEFVNLGIGINVLTKIDQLPVGATSLKAASGRDIPIDDVERTLMERLTEWYSAFLASRGNVPLTGWIDRAIYLGEQVEIEQNGAVLAGIFGGVSPQGALILETPDGAREIVAGDLTRGPRSNFLR